MTQAHRTYRKEAGLRKIQRGKRMCLKCDNIFSSPDPKQIRICKRCKKNFEYRRIEMSFDD